MASKSPLPLWQKFYTTFGILPLLPITDNYHCHNHCCKHQFGIVQIQTLLQSPHSTHIM